MRKIKSKKRLKKITSNLRLHPKRVKLPQENQVENLEKNHKDDELIKVLAEIRDELKLLNKNFSRVIEPEILLDHYSKGASLRVDNSSSRLGNPTL